MCPASAPMMAQNRSTASIARGSLQSRAVLLISAADCSNRDATERCPGKPPGYGCWLRLCCSRDEIECCDVRWHLSPGNAVYHLLLSGTLQC